MARDPLSNPAATVPTQPAGSSGRPRRGERLHFRLPQESAELIRKAAELEQRTVTEFCTNAAVQAAREAVARHEQLELSGRDRAVFFEALMTPPEPNEKLRRAAEAAKARIRSA